MVVKSYDQKYFSWCLLKPPFLLFLVTLIPSTAFFCFMSSHELFSLLTTITVFLISTTVLFLKFSKKKTSVCLNEKHVQEEEEEEEEDDDDESATVDTQTQACIALEGEAGFECEMMILPSDADITSSGAMESDGLDVSSCSDDDDSLIEIALVNDDGSPRLCQEETKQNLQNNLWVEYSVSREEQISNDVHFEEENLIEIDISMGSIKRPAVEI